ncbi:hypothetical protein V12B01_13475 [Vibrio splendidus 12B01]|nr:hypothetical protein V12B01_13475 [Vibrio splendidus 12B01]
MARNVMAESQVKHTRIVLCFDVVYRIITTTKAYCVSAICIFLSRV